MALRGFAPADTLDDGWGANWELEAEFAPGLGLGALTGLTTLPGVDAQHVDVSALEKAVGALDAIRLRRVGLALAASSSKVMALHVDIVLKDAWTLVAHKFELTDVRLALAITLPTIAPRADVTLSATLLIAEVPVAASISYPELAISAELEEPVPAEKLFGQYLPEARVDMDIERAALAFDATTRDWQIEFGVAGGKRDDGTIGGWRLADKVTLTEVSMSVAGRGQPAGCQLLRGFDAGGIPILLAGSYDAGSWSLLGESVAPEGIHIGALLKSLSDDIGVTAPAAVTGMDLTLVKLEVSTTGPSLLFICDGKFPVGAGEADFEVYLDVGPDGAGTSLRVDSAAWLELTLHRRPEFPATRVRGHFRPRRELDFGLGRLERQARALARRLARQPARQRRRPARGAGVRARSRVAAREQRRLGDRRRRHRRHARAAGDTGAGHRAAPVRGRVRARRGRRPERPAAHRRQDPARRRPHARHHPAGREQRPQRDAGADDHRRAARARRQTSAPGHAPAGRARSRGERGASVKAGGKPVELPTAPPPPAEPAPTVGRAPAAPGAWLDVGRSSGPCTSVASARRRRTAAPGCCSTPGSRSARSPSTARASDSDSSSTTSRTPRAGCEGSRCRWMPHPWRSPAASSTPAASTRASCW